MNRFLTAHEEIDVDQIMESIRKKIKEKKESGLLKDQDIREIEDMELQPLPDFLDIPNVYQPHLYADIGPIPNSAEEGVEETGAAKALLKKIRSLFFPLIRFMFRPLYLELKNSIIGLQNQLPTIIQSKEYIRLLHNTLNNVISEMTKLKIEQEMLKTKTKILEDKLEFLENRERAIEKKIAS